MKRTILATIMLVALAFSSEAYDFKSGDLCYNITSSTEPYTVEVTYNDSISGLSIVTIPTTVTYNSVEYSVTSIGSFAFSYYYDLKSVTIPNSVTSIGNYAFQSCSSLTSVIIPNSITNIGEKAFFSCSALTSVTIPYSVIKIDSWAFDNCSSLTSINVEQGNSEYSSADGILYNVNETTLIMCPQGKTGSFAIPNYVTSIGSLAFDGCSGLDSVTIPNSVTSIGDRAFDDCSGLKSITIPNSVTSIGYATFYGCSGLVSVTIPNSVTNIGNMAFYHCSGLKSVTIPNSVTIIGTEAFDNCINLTSVTIPNSVTIFGSYAFRNCISLTKVEYKGSLANWLNILFGDYFANPLCYAQHLYINNEEVTSVVIPDTITEIKPYAFSGCSGLTSITIPNSVTSIGNDAFYGVRLINYNGSATGSPWGALSINGFREGDFVYSNADKDTIVAYIGSDDNVTIPDSVKGINNNALYGVKHINYNGNATGRPWGALSINGFVDGDFVYSDAEKTILATYIGADESVIIPNSVISIGDSAFYECIGLTSVTIPNSVSSIGHLAFRKCSDLTSIIIPNSVTTVGVYVFSGCSNVTIYCEATEISFDWSLDWNPDKRPVVWGYTGINNDIASNVNIYAHHNTIVVENADADIFVYDATGRLIARRDVACHVSITMPQQGIYIVKVGNDAKRVIVGY